MTICWTTQRASIRRSSTSSKNERPTATGRSRAEPWRRCSLAERLGLLGPRGAEHFEGADSGRVARLQSEFGENAGHLLFDRALAVSQDTGDLAVAFAL